MKKYSGLIKTYTLLYLLALSLIIVGYSYVIRNVTKGNDNMDFGRQGIISQAKATEKGNTIPSADTLAFNLPRYEIRKSERSETLTAKYFPKYNISITTLSQKQLDYFYYENNPPSLSQLAKRNNCEFAFNASYFAGTKLDANHVGLLSIWGKTYVPLGVERQLTHVAVFNKQTETIEFYDAATYKSKSNGNLLEFQTGPLVLADGKIQSQFIDGSANGMYDHKRLLIATDDSLKIYIIVVRSKADLYEIAEYLNNLDIFSPNLRVLNLDGGKSVGVWDKVYTEINYNSNDRLPLVLCVR